MVSTTIITENSSVVVENAVYEPVPWNHSDLKLIGPRRDVEKATFSKSRLQIVGFSWQQLNCAGSHAAHKRRFKFPSVFMQHT